MFLFKSAVLLLTLLVCTVRGKAGTSRSEGAVVKEDTRRSESEEPKWIKLCNCAKKATRRIQDVITEYANKTSRGNVKKSSSYKPPALDEVIERIKKIAHDCTKRPDCRCPKGYFKTSDDKHCLQIASSSASCEEAVKACAENANARLAVAKDHKRLTALADYIRELDPTDESFYWIGLSYNRTDGGIPLWTWEDGTQASYAITKDLKNPVKKSLQLSILDGNETPRAIERVAISKNYEGTHWKQEACSHQTFPVKHKYICEFLMFKVQIRAVSASSKSENSRTPAIFEKQRKH